ncbi:MAG: O-antigen ligase family protein [Candidatus Uhrbacteria bacterium]
MGELLPQESSWPRILWGLFLLCALAVLAITAQAQVGILFLLLAALAIVLSWRFPYEMFSLWAPLSFLLGFQISVSTGYYRIGERTLGASFELSIGELLAVGLVAAWALRVLLLWRGRRDRNWKPWLPLGLTFLALGLVHLFTIWSSGQPSPFEVLKFVARYQLFLYLACVALVVNFVRSKKRLRQVLMGFIILGTFFAFDGLRNMVVIGDGGISFQQAQPLAMLVGLNPLGGNQHSLAETLIMGEGAALAFAALSAVGSNRRKFAYWAAGLMAVVSILTFSRTAWLVMALQVTLLFATIWKQWFKTHIRELMIFGILSLPLVGLMVAYSLTRLSIGSLDARASLTGIAWTFFTGSPWLGVGAGTFADRVAITYAFLIDYGSPLDSHGIFQKVGAEAGLFGLIALLSVIVEMGQRFWKDWYTRHFAGSEHVAHMFLLVTAIGAFAYQVTSTSYWTPRLWIPIALALAAGRVFQGHDEARDPDFLRPSHG